MSSNKIFFSFRGLFLLIVFSVLTFSGFGQFEKHPYHFTDIREIKTTPVKNQQHTGTCWCFATTSFVETEILRMGGPALDLSEMFTVRHAYDHKGRLYVRYHGLANFGPGGQAHDVINMIRQYGFVPEEVYPGKDYGDTIHNHGELNAILNAYLDAVVKNRNRKLTPAWPKGFSSVLDVYLGKNPESFVVDGVKYTPKSFRDHFKFNPDDYIELTSYTHHPFYTKFGVEVPDNWSHDLYYNVPLDELISVMYNALAHGYSVAWDGDVSEKGFSYKNGVAILPEKPWSKITGKDSVFKHPVKEWQVDAAMRQKTFDDYATTDDHLMHLVGTGTDENGTHYYLTKNSWGTKSNKYSGYLFMSEPYVRLKTLAILVHKDALPKELKKKLRIK